MQVKAIALDVDGTLTDGGFWWGDLGEELKRFSYRDVMGISIGTRNGLKFALISGEDSNLVDRFAEKMHIADVYKGCKDKAAALQDFAKRAGVSLGEICFMGDDVNDLPAMRIAGFSGAPSDAVADVKACAKFVSGYPGGHGAVRDLIDHLLTGSTIEWSLGQRVAC